MSLSICLLRRYDDELLEFLRKDEILQYGDTREIEIRETSIKEIFFKHDSLKNVLIETRRNQL